MDSVQKFIKITLDGKPFLKKKLEPNTTLRQLRTVLNLNPNIDFTDEDFPIANDDETMTKIEEIIHDNTICLMTKPGSVETVTVSAVQSKTSNSKLGAQILSTSFGPVNSKYFEYSNNNKTLKKTHNETCWIGAICKDKVVDKVTEFSVRIDKSERFFICIGYATIDTEFNGVDLGYNEMKFSWMCNLANGKFKNGGVSDLYFCDASVLSQEVGAVYTVCIDMGSDVMYLKRNGVEIGEKLKLQISGVQKGKISGCIDILEQDDQITLV